jgi:demethylmenaquinone methyltransferase/2-methoxy-6-polyprenyl-1,4-benzoquinol methylase
MDRELLDEQIAYYRARAAEYDEWFFRQGRYDRGEAHRKAWFAELEAVEAALRSAEPRGRVLELACGTGLWTRHLVERASEVTAIDAAPEALARNRERLASDRVRYVQADLFRWQPRDLYDFVFFGFWLSHVPPDRFAPFWATVRTSLASGGKVFFVDNAHNAEIAARNHQLPKSGFVMDRVLNDGRQFRMVKVFYEPEDLTLRLATLGFTGTVRGTGEYFVYGCVTVS